jgi:two-component system chemotaxis response regulator CheB
MTIRRCQLVVLGGSAGGPAALGQILAGLPADFPAAVLVVQHRHRHPGPGVLLGLRLCCDLPLREAEAGEPVRPGTVLVAPANYHLLVEPDGRVGLSVDEKVNHSRPAIDVTFESAALVYGDALAGVVLSGASADGAVGLQAVRRRGGLTIVQAPADAEVDYMPRSAIEAGPVDFVVPAHRIAGLLAEVTGQGRREKGTT